MDALLLHRWMYVSFVVVLFFVQSHNPKQLFRLEKKKKKRFFTKYVLLCERRSSSGACLAVGPSLLAAPAASGPTGVSRPDSLFTWSDWPTPTPGIRTSSPLPLPSHSLLVAIVLTTFGATPPPPTHRFMRACAASEDEANTLHNSPTTSQAGVSGRAPASGQSRKTSSDRIYELVTHDDTRYQRVITRNECTADAGHGLHRHVCPISL